MRSILLIGQNMKKVRLVSDGCAGQNKNSANLAMNSFWLDWHAPDHINEVEIMYPVTGHSFFRRTESLVV